jgi:hypothetical protein
LIMLLVLSTSNLVWQLARAAQLQTIIRYIFCHRRTCGYSDICAIEIIGATSTLFAPTFVRSPMTVCACSLRHSWR